MNPIRRLPSDVQSLIYEFAGPDPGAENAHNEFLDLIDTGRVGIPAWHIYLESFGAKTQVIRQFVTPSYDYFDNIKIRNNKWWFPKDLTLYYYNKYNIRSPYMFKQYIDELSFITKLRKDTLLESNDEYSVANVGVYDAPYVSLSFREMDDYDLLYTLKSARGDNIEDARKSVESWANFEKGIMKSLRYSYDWIDRCHKKWMDVLDKA
jgi:hypothetical protein